MSVDGHYGMRRFVSVSLIILSSVISLVFVKGRRVAHSIYLITVIVILNIHLQKVYLLVASTDYT